MCTRTHAKALLPVRVSPLPMVYPCAQYTYTERQTDFRTCDFCSNRPHLCYACDAAYKSHISWRLLRPHSHLLVFDVDGRQCYHVTDAWRIGAVR